MQGQLLFHLLKWHISQMVWIYFLIKKQFHVYSASSAPFLTSTAVTGLGPVPERGDLALESVEIEEIGENVEAGEVAVTVRDAALETESVQGDSEQALTTHPSLFLVSIPSVFSSLYPPRSHSRSNRKLSHKWAATALTNFVSFCWFVWV